MKKTISMMLIISAVLIAQVDMFNRKVTAEGMGMPDKSKNSAVQRFGAFRAAEADALRKIMEEIKGMPIDSRTVVEDFVLQDDRVKTQMEGIAKLYEVVGEPEYHSDGRVDLTIELTLYEIDWKGKIVKVKGIGTGKNSAMALRAAELDSKRKMMERVKGVYLAGETMMNKGEIDYDRINMQSQGVLRNAHIVNGSEKYFDDGSVEVTCELKLDENLKTIPGFSSVLMKDMEFDEEYPLVEKAKYKLSDIIPETKELYTGLIIDCTDLTLRPALAPKIFSKNGEEIYGTSKVSKSFAVQQGMFGYEKDINKAKNNLRVGKNPLVIKGVSVKGINKTDIVITQEDSEKVKDSEKAMKFLGECRVIALLK